MMFFLTPWVLPGLFGVLVSAVAARIALRRRARPGARELVVLSAAVGWWCLTQAVSVTLPSLEGKVLLAKLQYLGVTAVPLAWLWFALRYTSRDSWISRAGWLLLIAPAAATLALAWTNELHGLIWRRLSLLPADSFLALQIEHGPWFRINVYYAYALVVAGTVVLVSALGQSPHLRRRLTAAVAAPLMPVVANLFYLVRLAPPRWIDLTPGGFALGGLLLAWSLLRDELLDLPPVARSRILEAIPDGILVLDRAGRVIDMNSAAERLLGVAPGAFLGAPWFASGADGSVEVAEHGERVLEIRRTGAVDLPGGMVVVARDVTEQHRLHAELRHLGDELLRANSELTLLANTDGLTGLASRRHFLQMLERELRRAVRYGRPLSLLLMDIDRFKEINDSLGHVAGDAVLHSVGEVILTRVRDVDVAGRLGGDELAVMLPDTDGEGARATAQRLLTGIRERTHRTPSGAEVSVTLSIGLVVASGGISEVEELLDRADIALYQAKAGGRDRIRAYPAEGAAVDGDPVAGGAA